MAGTEAGRPGLREITRQAVRTRIAEAAMELFAARGFEATTVDQIAAEVGISGRSVFRYFASKEDMVVGHLDEIGERLATELAARPPEEPPWVALRHAMDPHLADLRRNADARLATAAMLSGTAALRGALLAKRARWVDGLVPDLVHRLDGPVGGLELRARAIASAALDCLNIAVDRWADSGGTEPVDQLLDSAIDAVRG